MLAKGVYSIFLSNDHGSTILPSASRTSGSHKYPHHCNMLAPVSIAQPFGWASIKVGAKLNRRDKGGITITSSTTFFIKYLAVDVGF